jgi:hypothetical protein
MGCAQIAAAVVTELNATDFGAAFTARRASLPEIDLTGGMLAVVVSNVKDRPHRYTKQRLTVSYAVDICFAQRLTAATLDADYEALDAVAVAVSRHFAALPRLPAELTAIVVETERFNADAERLRSASEYVGIVRLSIEQTEELTTRPPREE